MSKWNEYKLGDVVTFQRGHDLPIDKMADGNIPVAGSNGIIGYHNQCTQEGPGVTIGRSGNIGIPHYYPCSYWAHNTVLYVKDFKGNNPKFIYYLLKTFDFTQLNTGSAVPSLNRNHIHELLVSIPDIDEQKRIVSILGSLDDKIDLLNRENATLEAMAETLFRQWFIEKAKEDWEEGTIDMYANHYKEYINPQKQPTTMFWHYSIPAFDRGKKPMDEMGEEIQSSKYIIPSNCILFSKLNPYKDKRVWLIHDDISANAICSTEFQIVKPKEKEYLYFLYGWLTNKENYREIASGVGGTSGSHQRIDPKSIFSYTCPHVDIGILQRYNKVVEPLLLKQRENQKQIITLTEQRDKLLPKLMSNEINIK